MSTKDRTIGARHSRKLRQPSMVHLMRVLGCHPIRHSMAGPTISSCCSHTVLQRSWLLMKSSTTMRPQDSRLSKHSTMSDTDRLCKYRSGVTPNHFGSQDSES